MEIYSLPRLDYLKLRFHLTAQTDCNLPAWKGSLIRGAFGHALRRTVCTMKRDLLCENCMLRSQCAYTRLFETFVTKPPPPFLKGLPNSPRPFIFEPMDYNKEYKQDDVLWFDLVLVGNIIQYIPYIVFAIFQLGKTGLGRDRYPFELKQAFCLQPNIKKETNNESNKTNGSDETDWKMIYDGETQKILFQPDVLVLNNSDTNKKDFNSAQINFLTQTRIAVNNKLSMDFTYRELVFKMLRRILELAHFYMPEEDCDWEFRELLNAANDVTITNKNLHWEDRGRYSSRQKKKLKIGGFVGDISLEGDLSPFLDLLKYCEVVHVGKGATFGLGKINYLKYI
jgi:hypothetical protein